MQTFPFTPSDSFQDSIRLIFDSVNLEKNLSTSYFDFDKSEFCIANLSACDIHFGITIDTPYHYYVLSPGPGASGMPIDDFNLVLHPIKFHLDSCSGRVDDFGTGGTPIPGIGATYCWKTDQNNLVELIIDEIGQDGDLYSINLQYTIWMK